MLFKKIRTIINEAKYVAKIQEALAIDNIFIRGLSLNGLRDKASTDLLNGKITSEFYTNVFAISKENWGKHYWEANKENIEKYFNKKA